MKISDLAQWGAVLLLLGAFGATCGCSSPSHAQSTSSPSQVQVVNTASQAIPILDVDAQTSFYASGGCNWSHASECQVIPLLNVPANQTAVVESISGLCQLDTNTQIAYYQLANETNGSGNVFLAPSGNVSYNIGTMLASTTTVVTAFNQDIRAYFHGGSSGVTVIFDALATAGKLTSTDDCSLNLTGHFVSIP